MNKLGNIAVAVAVTAFIATNLMLLYGQKSLIPKYVYAPETERMVAADYADKLPKEAFVVPDTVYTAYVDGDATVEEWLVKEGEPVTAGQPIAKLDAGRMEGQRSVWQSEQSALEAQERELESTLSQLERERRSAQSGSNSNTNERFGNSGTDSDSPIVDLSVDVNVDVPQEGAYAHAITAVENQLADIRRQLTVVEAQLEQSGESPSLVSPVEGTVAKVHRQGEQLAVDVYSSERTILTYAAGEEWQDIQQGDRVFIQAPGLDAAIEGSVYSVSEVEAPESKWLDTYRDLDKQDVSNPLAYYEVRILPNEDVGTLPFANNVNAVIYTEEAFDAVAVKTAALSGKYRDEAIATVIDGEGYAVSVPVITPFDWKGQSVITDNLYAGDFVITGPIYDRNVSPPAVILPMPLEWPSKEEWKAHDWRDYMRFVLFQ
ncbi:efflux transporter, RND family, MFP subunit [Bhargavaea cecembensis DSE10]|uniref:Efflux transporter, RND family, MFP subunit n=1 Tax=Bhargavaea cecembensis DSE10 TaxID=1235279 RepID=M7P211_9BACL|nr:biotin/lipoyl-binding protein [Bhargavaea cecembensis]EMR07915.1 efflux transporter, RND family, MFP subunit [Bhargavaea cecembensis DSE10]